VIVDQTRGYIPEHQPDDEPQHLPLDKKVGIIEILGSPNTAGAREHDHPKSGKNQYGRN
jgi:hypothetical protein